MAQKDMYLNFNGTITGEAKSKGHEDQVEIEGFSWGLVQEGDLHKGTGGGRGKVAVHDLTVTKSLDRSTTELIKAGINLKPFDTVTLICRESGGEESVNYLEFEMSNVVVTSVSMNKAEGSGKPSETITLQFAKFKFKYSQQANAGSKEAEPHVTYDIKTQELVAG